jgi:copper oxidase (laccase) domain-containing protein
MLGGDCAPIALVAPHGVGVLHAGWPGLAGGVVDAAVEALAALRPADAGASTPSPRPPAAAVRSDTLAVVGPAIRGCCYEFGAADLARVEDRAGVPLRTRTRDGRLALDLVGGLRAALARAGVERVLDLGVCTSCSPRHFSYRRDGRTGRQAVVAVRRP